MASASSVSIDVLRKTINGIFDFIEKDLSVTEVALKQNYYWTVAEDVLCAMESPPRSWTSEASMTIGILYWRPRRVQIS